MLATGRYINNKCTEYFLQADRIPEAEATVALFTRHEGDPQQNLYDMQCMWYEIDCGRSHLRQKQYGKALKKFLAVEAHFKDFQVRCRCLESDHPVQPPSYLMKHSLFCRMINLTFTRTQLEK